MSRYVLVCMLMAATSVLGQKVDIDSILIKSETLASTDTTAALRLAGEALNLAIENKEDAAHVRSLYAIGRIRAALNQVQNAEEAFQKGIAMAQELKDPALMVSGQLALGEVYLEAGSYAASIHQFKAVLSENIKTSLQKEKAIANGHISTNYRHLSQFDSAMAYALSGQRIFENIGDTAGWIDCQSKRGNIYLLTGDYEQARSLFADNDRLLRSFRDSALLAQNILLLGVVEQKTGNYSTAREYYRRSLALSTDLKIDRLMGILNGNIGSTLMQEKRYAEGLPYLKQALILKEKAGASPGNLCHTYMDLSEIYRRMDRPDTAAVLARKLIELAEADDNEYYTYNGYLYLSTALFEAGAYADAYTNLVIAHEKREALLNENKSKQIQELQISYETEKKDAAIAALEQAKLLETKQKQLYLMLGLGVFLLGTGVYLQQRSNAKKNRLLLAKEKEVDALKSNFFANMSHEFRTPLTLILGPIESRLQKTADPIEREDLNMMKRNATRLLRLINDILDLSKSEAGQLKLEEETTDITLSVKGLAGSFTSMAVTNKVDFRTDVEPAATDLTGIIDRNKFETVLMNLLSNAFKFTPAGGKVTVRVFAEQAEGVPTIHCVVSDTGSGIPADKLGRIFDRFYQVDDRATRKAQGTGIGLAFSAELARVMGGSLTATSAPGEGSEFTFSVPYTPTAETAVATATTAFEPVNHAPEEPALQPAEGDAPLVLLVEDNSDLRAYIRSILGDNYRIATAIDGREGLNRAFDIVPDVIISDVMMPIMDGYELCTALKADMRTSHIPVIMLTAKSSVESRIKGLETEADVYMSKPFNPRELDLQVRNMLNLHSRLRQKYREQAIVVTASEDLSSMEQQFFTKLNKVVETHYADPDLSAEKLSAEMGMSRSQLHRKLKALMDESATGYVRRYRLQLAHQMLKADVATIAEIAYRVGFNNVSYFNKCFLEAFGKRPGEVLQ